MTTAKPLLWEKATKAGDRWQGSSALGRVYIVTKGDSGWLWGIDGGGWREPVEKEFERARELCQDDWNKAVLAELVK